jgi:Kef-type K+ transport system membrane component KefB
MTEVALLLAIASLGYGISRWSGIPAIPLLLGLGMLLSFSGLVKHADLLTKGSFGDDPVIFVLELGLTVLVFASGIELNPQRFRRQRRPVVWVGLIQFAVMGLVGYFAARALGFSGMEPVYLAFAVSASSTVVVLRQLQVSQQSFEPQGRMVIGVLLLQDGLTIATLIALTHFSDGIGWLAAGYGWAIVMALAAWYLQRRLARWLIERSEGDEELMLLTILTILFLFLGAAHLADLPVVVGAFLAGYSLSSFPVSGLVNGLILSLTDFFRAIFFVALGALVVIPGASEVSSALGLAVLVILITPPLVAAVAEWTGLTSRAAIESGLLLAQTSEYSLILGLIGMQLGHLSGGTFAVIAMMAVATMTCTPLLSGDGVARFLLRLHPLRRRRRQPALDLENHVLVLGLGSGGMWVLRPLLSAGVPLLVVDDDPVVIAELDLKGVPCIRGDGSDEHVLERAGADKAQLIIASMRRLSDSSKVMSLVRGVPVFVRVFEDGDAEAVREMGGTPISNSEAAVDQFQKWFEGRFPRRAG